MKRKNIWLFGLEGSVFSQKAKYFGVKRRFLDEEDEGRELLDSSRTRFFYLAIVFVLFVFLTRLFILSIVNGDLNRALADENRIRLVTIEAERGSIFDRNGRKLASSKRVYFLKKNAKSLAISLEQVRALEQEGLAGENFEGELGMVVEDVIREYPLDKKAAHVLGYLSFGDLGRLGLEEIYNDFLAGKAGKKLVEVDALGKKVSILGNKMSVGGRDLVTTIDANLQEKVFDVLEKQAKKVGSLKGAVVAQDPNTGGVLALASVPSFDPLNIEKYVSDASEPFFNRVVLGTYPPGSVFKIVSGLSGLETGAVTKDTEIEDVGEFYLGDIKFSNWFYSQYGKKDGILKIDRAIARSNDIFFYRLAEKVGLDSLREMAIKLGYGKKTGIDLGQEAFGLVPDEVWKQSTFETVWYPGDTMHLGIGQGFMLATPIQVNVTTSYMASGKLTKPYIASKIMGEGEEIQLEGKIISENIVARENFDLVREGMRQACAEGGTGWPFFNAPYTVGCKTGTAERELGNPHAWFTAFAPYDDPQVAITVLIEEGGEGSSVAGPVAREILDWYFQRK